MSAASSIWIAVGPVTEKTPFGGDGTQCRQLDLAQGITGAIKPRHPVVGVVQIKGQKLNTHHGQALQHILPLGNEDTPPVAVRVDGIDGDEPAT